MQDYVFKTEPYDHQRERFLEYRDKEYHGHFWEQGTGKSKMIIDQAAWLYGQGKIDCLVIIAPNGVHRNWIINELPAHCPDYVDYKAVWYVSSMNKRDTKALQQVIDHDGLSIVTMNIESMATKKGVTFLKNLLILRNTLLVIDESTSIKNFKAKRTKALLDLSIYAKYRRILTGTPITQGPLDYWAQFTFLSHEVLGQASYYGYRNRYAVMKDMVTKVPGQPERRFKVVDSYQNLPELIELTSAHCDRVLKEECLDLPAKLYQKRYIELTTEQRVLYNQFKRDAVAELNGMVISAPLLLTKMLRLQQIVGGFFQADTEVDFDDDMNPIITKHDTSTPINKENKRVNELINVLKETNGKVIIFARFRNEISAIVKQISEEFGGESYVEYHGGVNQGLRSNNIKTFQENEACRYFIANVQAAGKGLTLTAATTVIYFSNNFSLEDRLQSEDRAHRIGQTKNVTYIDFVAQDTCDEKIVDVLRSKKSIADMITGDKNLEYWL